MSCGPPSLGVLVGAWRSYEEGVADSVRMAPVEGGEATICRPYMS